MQLLGSAGRRCAPSQRPLPGSTHRPQRLPRIGPCTPGRSPWPAGRGGERLVSRDAPRCWSEARCGGGRRAPAAAGGRRSGGSGAAACTHRLGILDHVGCHNWELAASLWGEAWGSRGPRNPPSRGRRAATHGGLGWHSPARLPAPARCCWAGQHLGSGLLGRRGPRAEPPTGREGRVRGTRPLDARAGREGAGRGRAAACAADARQRPPSASSAAERSRAPGSSGPCSLPHVLKCVVLQSVAARRGGWLWQMP